ncbi:hypothetical protein [Allomesorhizobium camelthorni]|uniref:Uncharacterized protein n=1 Tax=Allomesorhizobium camelthorni TaxID=475069 RepID=A0A6G4W868_9HYPH|nr:hypothetical protein [Mesorhizobium camelthorni]NGO50436.1 hypothetical protein [Mesorhizobium camelthorni]
MSNIKVYRRQGGDAQVIAAGGKLVVQTGGQIVPNSETQAANIADVSTATIAWTTGDKAKVNSVFAALKGVGVLATS